MSSQRPPPALPAPPALLRLLLACAAAAAPAAEAATPLPSPATKCLNATTFAGPAQVMPAASLGIAVSPAGDIFVADQGSHMIFRVAAGSSETELFSGNYEAGYVDGIGKTARLSSPQGLAFGRGGDMFIADTGNNRFRRVTIGGAVSRFCGIGTGGTTDSICDQATFTGVFIAPIWDEGLQLFFVLDSFDGIGGSKLRTIKEIGGVDTVKTLLVNFPNVTKFGGGALSPDRLTMYVSSYAGNEVLAVDVRAALAGLPGSLDAVTLFAGQPLAGIFYGVGSSAQFSSPANLVTNAIGDIFLSDFVNKRIRRIDVKTRNVTTHAGTNYLAITMWEEGIGTNAMFGGPTGLAITPDGTLFVSDLTNKQILKITPGGNMTQVTYGAGGLIDGLGLDARFKYQSGLAFGPSDVMYIGDDENARIRAISPAGVVTSVAGSGPGRKGTITVPLPGQVVDDLTWRDGVASEARLNDPQFVAVFSGTGDVAWSEAFGNRVRVL